MSTILSPDLEARIRARAEAEGMAVDAHLEHLIEEREIVGAVVERAESRTPSLDDAAIRAKIERGFQQSERGEVVDGEEFAAGLLAELDEIESKRRAG
jgi:predicted transcriptional regulator